MFGVISVDLGVFFDPIESAIATAAPIVIGLIAAVFGLNFLIDWVRNRLFMAQREREYDEYNRGERDSVG